MVREPGREFHVADLADLTGTRRTTAADVPDRKVNEEQLAAQHLSITDLGDAGVGLDQQARTAYKRRLEELRDELAEAHRFNDLGRAAKAQSEIDLLMHELRTAYGFGGHARWGATVREKLRQAVTKALHRSLRQIEHAHPTLGRHLRASLRTGTL
jgi:hypothetical protein